MEEILSSIRRIIADEHDDEAPGGRADEAAEVEDEMSLDALESDADHHLAALEEDLEVEREDMRSRAPAQAQEEFTSSAESEAVAKQEDHLVSSSAADASTNAFARLAKAAAGDHAQPVPGGDKTVEQFIVELLTPMLKEWLDQNLQTIVERVVEQEVKKLARRAELM